MTLTEVNIPVEIEPLLNLRDPDVNELNFQIWKLSGLCFKIKMLSYLIDMGASMLTVRRPIGPLVNMVLCILVRRRLMIFNFKDKYVMITDGPSPFGAMSSVITEERWLTYIFLPNSLDIPAVISCLTRRDKISCASRPKEPVKSG